MLEFTASDLPDFSEHGSTPCSESDPDSFFAVDSPEGNIMKGRASYVYEREVKQICAACPYAARCLQYALSDPDLQGIWGGTTERQRKNMRRGKPVSHDVS